MSKKGMQITVLANYIFNFAEELGLDTANYQNLDLIADAIHYAIEGKDDQITLLKQQLANAMEAPPLSAVYGLIERCTSEYKAIEERNKKLEAALTPRLWTKEMQDAWHECIPDTNLAFMHLRRAATGEPT